MDRMSAALRSKFRDRKSIRPCSGWQDPSYPKPTAFRSATRRCCRKCRVSALLRPADPFDRTRVVVRCRYLQFFAPPEAQYSKWQRQLSRYAANTERRLESESVLHSALISSGQNVARKESDRAQRSDIRARRRQRWLLFEQAVASPSNSMSPRRPSKGLFGQ